MSVPEAAANLFQLPPEEFTAERDRIARDLKRSGDTDQAAAVKALKRPSVAAYALNLVARTHSALVEDLLVADERLRTATSRTAMDSAKAGRQKAIGAITSRASSMLVDEGRPVTAQVIQKLTETLLAVATDHETRERLRAGELVKEAEPTGFGGPITAFDSSQPAGRGRVQDERSSKLRAEAEVKFAEARKALADSERALRESRELAEASAAAKERSEKLGNLARRAEQQARAKLAEAEELENRPD